MTPKPPRRRWFQFGLQTLFVVVTVASIAAYWFARPTILAREFILALQANDYATANSLINDGPMKKYFDEEYFVRRTSGREIFLEPLTVGGLLSGRRRLIVDVGWNFGGYYADFRVSQRGVEFKRFCGGKDSLP